MDFIRIILHGEEGADEIFLEKRNTNRLHLPLFIRDIDQDLERMLGNILLIA